MNRFVDYLPPVYGLLYNAQEMAEHAAIAARRGDRLVHAEMWQSATGPRLCVIAMDRPGLLALITDALLAQGVAIRSARAFCREVGGDENEAVDFLELRSVDGPEDSPAEFDEGALESFTQFLTDLVADDLARASHSKSGEVRTGSTPTRVYFERQSLADGRYLLVVDAPDSNGMLHAISSSLHAMGMRIIACEIRTVGGRASDRFELEPDSGKSLSDTALCDVQVAVLDALPSRIAPSGSVPPRR